MLEAIKKVFSGEQKEVNMKQEKVQPVLAANETTAQLSVAQEALASKVAEFNALNEQFTQLSSELAQVKEALLAVESYKEQLIADGNKKRMDARKEKIVMSIGTAKADALMAATESLDDAAFEAIVGAMAVSFETEANTAMFKEVGVTAEAEAALVVEESSLEAALKQKYRSK